MDNVKYTSEAYESGLRAYEKLGEMCWQWTEGGIYRKVDAHEVKDWHSLRAYQDEQRKKGVPIVMSSEEAIEFGRLCHRIPTQFNYVNAYTGHPGIQSITPQKPYGQIVNGRFTNFRWREGYPKQPPHIKTMGDGFVDLTESPLVLRIPIDPNDRPLGGVTEW
jgi:hypothetical protein